MSAPFLITALPCSRTAWMAIAASMASEAICSHEPLLQIGSWDLVKRSWRDPEHEFVGISDSAMGFRLGEVLADIRPRTLIIERDPAEVDAVLLALSPVQTNYCDLLAARLAEFKNHPLVRCVAFSDLSRTDVVVDALDWLMPGLMFDHDKIEQLQHMNVAINMDRVWRLADQRRSDLESLIGPDAKNIRRRGLN